MSKASFVPVTGRKGTGTHPRLAIEDLQANEPYQFALFILSYLQLQGRDVEEVSIANKAQQSNDLKVIVDAVKKAAVSSSAIETMAMQFEALGGIHGLPYNKWQGDQKDHSKADYDPNDPKDQDPHPSRFGGYCTHGSVLFPSWHRPYVMVLEQALGDVAVKIAERLENTGFFEKSVWTNAANAWRFPFWDWAEKKVATEGLPRVLSDDTVELSMGSEKFIVPNPLAYFRFKNIPAGFQDITAEPGVTAYFSEWKRTLRYATSDPNANHSDTDALNKELKKEAPGLRRRIAALFALSAETDPVKAARTYDEFSNHTIQSDNILHNYNGESLEGVHDTVHDVLGGNGHLAYPDYAGFDPLFWLHHCNVDRLYALWEYVYPREVYIGDGSQYEFTQNTGTYTLTYNSLLLGKTELTPFRLADGSYWTSDEARFFYGKAYPKYYTYPEVSGVKIDHPPTDEEREEYREALQAYYGLEETSSEDIPKRSKNLPSGTVPKDVSVIPGASRIVVSMQTPEFAFNGPYSIRLVYCNHKKETTHVGTMSVFARQPWSKCSSCKKRRDTGSIIHSVLPVPTKVIQEIAASCADNKDDVDIGDVMEKLKKCLKATITTPNGKVIAMADGGSGHVGSDEALNKYFAPVVTLASSAVGRAEGRTRRGRKAPISWVDWKSHGDVFEPEYNGRRWKWGPGAEATA